MNRVTLAFTLVLMAVMTACGGGGGASGTPPPPPVQQSITISSNAQLPGALQGQQYSTTLAAANGQGALKWSMSSSPSSSLYPTGLTIDSATGVLSGMPNFQGLASFIATVVDANNRTASKTFQIGGYGTLAAGAPVSITSYQYQNIYSTALPIQGGVPPLKFSLASGSLPFGVTIGSTGQVQGSANQSGTYSAVINVSDSWTPPQSVNQSVSIAVSSAGLWASNNVPYSWPLNQPANFAVFPFGGAPPYSFKITSGGLPSGVTLDLSTGKISGSPSDVTSGSAAVQVTDSVGTTAFSYIYYSVIAAKGRNDSIQTATQLHNYVSASLSPYIDPPNKAPLAADNDYYTFVSMAGSTVHVTMQAQSGNIDPVIEILDANGFRLSTCNSADYTATNFSSSCVNDEDGQGGHNAALDYRVPGNSGDLVNSYIHALDWSGNARPDMQYGLNMSGAVEPVYLQLNTARGLAYNYQIYLPYAFNGTKTWTIESGTLPDGLSVSNAGVISGTATTDGTFNSKLKVVDSSTPPQMDYVFVTMQVNEPVKITSSATLPTACVNKFYSFTPTSSGGTPPVYWGVDYSNWRFSVNSTTGNISGSWSSAGTFTTTLTVNDAAGSKDTQNISLTFQDCP